MPEKPSKNPNLKHTSHFSFAEKQKLWGKYRNQNSGINHQEKKSPCLQSAFMRIHNPEYSRELDLIHCIFTKCMLKKTISGASSVNEL